MTELKLKHDADGVPYIGNTHDVGALTALHYGDSAPRGRNLLMNGGLWFAQSQAAGTLTTPAGTFTASRAYTADGFAITTENATGQYRRVDTIATPETGFGARFYGEFKKITNAGKFCVSQVIPADAIAHWRGRPVRVQVRLKNSVGSHTIRIILLQLTTAGTVDSVPGWASGAPSGTFVSAFNSAGTDPTFGTNLSAITPSKANANCSISGNGLSCTLGSTWVNYGGVFVVPSDAKNLVLVLVTNGQMAANDDFHAGEIGLYGGIEERVWSPLDATLEFLRCQRWVSSTFPLDSAPAQAFGAGTGELRWTAQGNAAVTNRLFSRMWPGVQMRAVPTVTTFNPSAANGQLRDITAAADFSATTLIDVTGRGFSIQGTGAAGTAFGNWVGIHLYADASL